jgi:hypothetical protein
MACDTGHAPSLGVLGKLAELYECSVADLLGDATEFRTADEAYRHHQQLAALHDPQATDAIHDFVAQLDHIDVHELAQMATTWAQSNGGGVSRRSLLLKVSAALSLASAGSALAGDAAADESRPGVVQASDDLSGIGHSQYQYPSTGRRKTITGEHYVVLRQTGTRLIGQSLPHLTG